MSWNENGEFEVSDETLPLEEDYPADENTMEIVVQHKESKEETPETKANRDKKRLELVTRAAIAEMGLENARVTSARIGSDGTIYAAGTKNRGPNNSGIPFGTSIDKMTQDRIRKKLFPMESDDRIL